MIIMQPATLVEPLLAKSGCHVQAQDIYILKRAQGKVNEQGAQQR